MKSEVSNGLIIGLLYITHIKIFSRFVTNMDSIVVLSD